MRVRLDALYPVLKPFDRPPEVAAEILELLGAEDQHDDGQHDEPVHDAEPRRIEEPGGRGVDQNSWRETRGQGKYRRSSVESRQQFGEFLLSNNASTAQFGSHNARRFGVTMQNVASSEHDESHHVCVIATELVRNI